MLPHIDLAQALTIFVGNLPTFIAVILAWMQSNRQTDDMRDSLLADFRRVAEVWNARLKHLEERD
jgi:hypothetical protein